MSLIASIKRLFSGVSGSGPSEAFNPELFVYVVIPEPIGPIDRGNKYEDPLSEALSTKGFGHVSGGGSSLSDERPDGSRVVESCGVDVDVTDLLGALHVIRERLPALGAPTGTQLQYTQHGLRLRDALETDGWNTGLPRAALHPGFGI